ncbi:helix-turn-helix domain-containing protein [Streptomyces boncukensis]|uniref:NsdA n=1 Tax=Streptomyces boncukensis TaxID=2711219 RepID=A0A6G4X0M2_9ACTN|nr:helix-turn-helix domain-containing protein [Streptomyces boncukensis]NGO71099.1 hypothetical protein [Streptomyces boncukensis]
MPEQSSSPPELPARLLSNPEMVDACRVRDFSQVFRLVKRHAGIYPSMIARRCGLTPSRVGEVMAGQRKLLHMDVIERIADGLRIPGHLLGLARREWETPPVLSTRTREAAPEEAPLPAESGTLPGTEVDRILAAAATSSPSPSTLQALRSSIQDYWRRDDEHGGEALRPAVLGQFRYVMSLLRETSHQETQRGLYAVAAELARLTGWTYFDARQYSRARTYFTEALRLAKAVDDQAFMANVMACMSLQATYQERPGDAVALATAAQDHARASAGTPRVMAMLSMREAFAHATLTRRRETHAALAESHRQFERITDRDPDPDWVAYFDEPKLIVDTGIAHARLGEADVAEPLITDALHRENQSNQRGRAFHSFWLARTQLQRGKLDEACHTAMSALTPASAVTSERVTGHLREFHEQLEPHRQEPAAMVFEARLRDALPVSLSEPPRP